MILYNYFVITAASNITFMLHDYIVNPAHTYHLLLLQSWVRDKLKAYQQIGPDSTLHSVSSSMGGGCFCFCLDFRLTEKSNRQVVTLLPWSNQSLSNEICPLKTIFIFDPEIDIFFAITPEISKLGCFINFMYC